MSDRWQAPAKNCAPRDDPARQNNPGTFGELETQSCRLEKASPEATREAVCNYCDTLLIRENFKSLASDQIFVRSDQRQAMYPRSRGQKSIRWVAVRQNNIFRR